MGKRRAIAEETRTGPDLRRGRPRSFVEWSALRRWGKLPTWEREVPGYLLRVAREQAAMTQSELAAKLGITQQAVSRSEKWVSNPTIALIRRWLEVCGCSLHLEIRKAEAETHRSSIRADADLQA